MKDVTEVRSLSDIRTATSHHIAAKPPLKGTACLDLYLLDREKGRLEKELSRLQVRQKRVHERLGEIRKAMATLEKEAERERPSDDPSSDISTGGRQPSPATQHGQGRWRKVILDY